MARGISLRRYEESTTFILNRGNAFRVRIEAYDNEGMPAEIFLHQKRLLDAEKQVEGEDFCAIAAPDDFAKYPVNTPTPTQVPPFYRKKEIDVLVESREQALELWSLINTRVCALVEALNKKDILTEAATTRCGDDLTDSSSASASTSASSSTSV
jgi:hypothetical protein